MARQYKTTPCPRCGESSRVAYARETARGTIRRRECGGCGNAFTTLEAPLCGPERSGNAIPVSLLAELAESLGIPVDRDAA